MIIPIRCFSCNKILADKYQKYIQYVKEYTENNPNKDETPVFHALNKIKLKRYCCRSTMMTNKELV